MRRLLLLGLAVPLACNVLPITISSPTDLTAVVGGITDQQPFFGTVGWPVAVDGSQLVVATCGCGDWRALVKPSQDGDPVQFVVQFFTAGDYAASGPITVFGQDSGNGLSGTIDQDSGAANGTLVLGDFKTFFSAQRSDEHQSQAEACALCHTGPIPVFPLPSTHPNYQLNPPNCLSHHQVNISN